MVVIHELMTGPLRYGDLKEHLPGIGSNVLSDRLKRLEVAGLIERRAGEVGGGVQYCITDRAEWLRPVFRELRRWGATMQIDDPVRQIYDHDLSWVVPPQLGLTETYEWLIGDSVEALTIDGQTLHQRPGPADDPAVVVTASLEYFQRWAAGDTNWDEGRASGEVQVQGSDEAWDRMLLATAYPGGPPTLATRCSPSSTGLAPSLDDARSLPAMPIPTAKNGHADPELASPLGAEPGGQRVDCPVHGKMQ